MTLFVVKVNDKSKIRHPHLSEDVMEKGEVARAASAWVLIGGLTWADMADIASFIASSLAAVYTLWLVIEKVQKKREAAASERP